MPTFKTILHSKLIQGVIIGIIVIALVLVVFEAGVLVGYRKARFTYGMAERYYKNFEGANAEAQKGTRNVFEIKDLPGGHGAVGRIISINFPQLVISGPDNVEKVITLSTSTMIIKFRDSASTTDLVADANIAVIGEPDGEGQIWAKLIRILP